MKLSNEVQQILIKGLSDYNNDPKLIEVYPTIVDYICKGHLRNIKNMSNINELCNEFTLCLKKNSNVNRLAEFILEGKSLNSLAIFLSHRLEGISFGKDKNGETCVLSSKETIQFEKQIKTMADNISAQNTNSSDSTYDNSTVEELANRIPKL